MPSPERKLIGLARRALDALRLPVGRAPNGTCHLLWVGKKAFLLDCIYRFSESNLEATPGSSLAATGIVGSCPSRSQADRVFTLRPSPNPFLTDDGSKKLSAAITSKSHSLRRIALPATRLQGRPYAIFSPRCPQPPTQSFIPCGVAKRCYRYYVVRLFTSEVTSTERGTPASPVLVVYLTQTQHGRTNSGIPSAQSSSTCARWMYPSPIIPCFCCHLSSGGQGFSLWPAKR